MTSSGPSPLLIALVPFLFLGMWCLTLLALAWLSGWRRLADRFATHRLPAGRRFRMQSGKVGPVGYNRSLTIHSADEGIYLSVLWPFRLGHAPLFIPWEAILNARRRRVLWFDRVEFEVGARAPIGVQLPLKAFDTSNVAVLRN